MRNEDGGYSFRRALRFTLLFLPYNPVKKTTPEIPVKSRYNSTRRKITELRRLDVTREYHWNMKTQWFLAASFSTRRQTTVHVAEFWQFVNNFTLDFLGFWTYPTLRVRCYLCFSVFICNTSVALDYIGNLTTYVMITVIYPFVVERYFLKCSSNKTWTRKIRWKYILGRIGTYCPLVRYFIYFVSMHITVTISRNNSFA